MIKKIGHFSPQILELLTAESDALGEKYAPQEALLSYTSIKDVLNSMDTTHERQQLLQRAFFVPILR